MAGQKRILVVDDDPDVHELLIPVLRHADRCVESAFDGCEGLKRVEETNPDLVIADVWMPGMDGMELLERIRSIKPETRVLMITAASTPENIIAAIRDRAFAWFSKPFTIEAVREMVSHALDSVPSDHDIEVLSARPGWLELRLRCKMETAARVVRFVREMEQGLSAREEENVATAFREILLNAIEHGGGNDPEKSVTITYVRAARALLYFVRDPGQGFSFDTLPHAAFSNTDKSPFEHTGVRERLGLRPGGFGILITRALVDELIYNEKGNDVLLIKYLPPREPS